MAARSEYSRLISGSSCCSAISAHSAAHFPAFFCQQLSHLNPPNYAIHKFPIWEQTNLTFVPN